MKRFMIITMLTCFGLLLAQDAAGTYKLSGTNVRYTSIARQTTVATVTDAYGLNVTTPVSVIPVNEGFYQALNGPFDESTLEQGGAFLNVTFKEDGTGVVNEGSYYPTIELDPETCVTASTVLPITDDLVYTSSLAADQHVQNINAIGLSSLSPFAISNGGPGMAGSISLSQSENLDFFTAGQSAGALGACLFGYYAGGAECDASQPGNDCDYYEGCPSAGYISKGHNFSTIVSEDGAIDNGVRDMYVEWHAVDGPLSQSGFGDDALDPCEDGLCVANAGTAACFELAVDAAGAPVLDADGNQTVTPSPACLAQNESLDRIFGIPFFGTTAMNPECGFNQNILGDSATVGAALGGGVLAACSDGVQADNDENGWADVVDACFGIEMGYGLPGDQAATMAFMGACEQLGFNADDCADLAAGGAGAITGQYACYDPVSHNLTVPNDDGTCNEGNLLELAWDCYGLAALTVDPFTSTVCGLAANAWIDDCVDGDSAGSTFYLLNAQFSQWGGFLTWNALQYGQTGLDMFLTSDGTVDFDPACLADCDGTNEETCALDCAGRLTMVQDPLCVPEFQVREVHIDFDEIEECAFNGDVTLDGVVNILDVVNLVQAILGLEELDDNQQCNANINEDAVVNILDVVAIVGSILGNRGIDATEIQIFNNENSVSIESNGYVGAIQMILNHSEDFAIELTDNAFIADYITEGNKTTLMVVAPEGKELFTAVGNFEIVETLAANSNDYLDVVNPEVISLGSAYPNPFNPTTSFELSVGNAGHVTMNVYNVMGQVVETLVNNTMDAGNYNITWDATNFSSGMYVVKAETANGLASQKVMLVK